MVKLLTLVFLTSCQTKNISDKIIGVDMRGKERRCDPMPVDTICTMDFRPADQFAMDCKDQGHLAIQCGCHDWICVK